MTNQIRVFWYIVMITIIIIIIVIVVFLKSDSIYLNPHCWIQE